VSESGLAGRGPRRRAGRAVPEAVSKRNAALISEVLKLAWWAVQLVHHTA